MHCVIAGGTGLIGNRLVEYWLKLGHTITIIGRTTAHIEAIYGSSVKAIAWENLSSDELKSADVVVNLTGASIGQKRWNEAYKKEIITSRVDSTKKLVDLLISLKKPPALLNASAVGIYGTQTPLPDQLPPRLDESTPINYENPPDYLSQVACLWEKAAEPAVAHGVRVVFMRFAVVLAKEGGALPMIMKPFQFYAGGSMGSGNQPFSWVAITDVVRAIDFLVTNTKESGAFNIVAPGCVAEKTLAETLAKLMNRPDVVKMPAFLLKMAMGDEMAKELLLEGQRAYPKRLLDSGFQFSYPNLESALINIFQEAPRPQIKSADDNSMVSKLKGIFGKKK